MIQCNKCISQVLSVNCKVRLEAIADSSHRCVGWRGFMKTSGLPSSLSITQPL